jgi:hypothetical protein
LTECAIELVAPDLYSKGESTAQRLRAAITLARLLASEGRAPRAASIGLDLQHAERELTECIRAETLALITSLFHAHLKRRSGLEPWRASAQSSSDFWLGIIRLEERKLGLALPSLPDPGEGRSAVAQRVLASALCLGLSEAAAEIWRGHLAFSEQDPVQADAAYRKVLDAKATATFAERAMAIAGVAGCLLDRGVVFLARDWMESHLDVAAACPDLIRLAGLANLAAGDIEAAGEFLAPQLRRCLPISFAALGDRRPELRAILSGPMEWERPTLAPDALTARRLDRSDVGAAALVVLQAPAQGGAGHVLFTDLARSLGEPSASWRDRQAAAPFTAGEPEQSLLARGKVWIGFTEDEGGERLLRSCLSPTAKAVALVPVRCSDSSGSKLLGWIRLEFEHRLVPDIGRLMALGRAARRAFLDPSTRPEQPGDEVRLTPLFEKLVGSFSLGRRRWWGFVRGETGPQFVASCGEALDNWMDAGGGCEALERAEALADLLGEPLQYGRSSTRAESVHRDAAGGAVIPIRSGGDCGSVCGWLVVESSRRGDLGEREIAQLVQASIRDGREIGLARFDLWHQAHCGDAVHFATRNLAPMPDALLALLDEETRERVSCGVDVVPYLKLVTQAAANCGGPVLITGAAGTGKRVAARLVLFERLAAAAAPEIVNSRGLQLAELESHLQLSEGRGVILEDIEELGQACQEHLFELLQQRDVDSRALRQVAMTSRTAMGESALWGRLAALLERHTVELAGMAARRFTLPAYFELFLARAARCERRVAPALSPKAAGLIWRGAWRGGLRELADFAHRVVIFQDSDLLEEQCLLRLSKQHAAELPRRLSSKHIDPIALWSALDANRKKSGGVHRGRTAALMGWDPDTLSIRLRELHLS